METSPEFDAPIPGMSLTHELGARPWQSPPQFPTVEGAVEYYIERMTTEEFKSQLFDVLEMGVSVIALVNTIQLASVMDGVHTVDVGILVSPILMEFIMLLADKAGIKYTTGLEDTTKEPRKTLVLRSLNKFREETDESAEEDTDTETVAADVPKEKPAMPTGLMARRQ